MTRRSPSLKLMSNDMATAELPATMPAVVQSSTQRLAWQREIASAMDERALIDEQIVSAERVCSSTKDEAERIRDARHHYADAAMDREFSDADKILAATSKSLRNRQADIDKIVAGFRAAINASGEDKPDGVQT